MSQNKGNIYNNSGSNSGIKRGFWQSARNLVSAESKSKNSTGSPPCIIGDKALTIRRKP